MTEPQTGGSMACSSDGYSYEYPWSSAPYGGWTAYGGVSGDAYGESASVNYSGGEVTTTVVWTPDYPGDPEEPPLSVIVGETCSASASGYTGPGGPADVSADNGLGAEAVWGVEPQYGSLPDPPYWGLVGWSAYSYSYSSRFKVQSGGSTVEVKLQPSVSASGNGQVFGGISYQVSITPVMIALQGTTSPPYGFAQNNNILVGQRCQASIGGAEMRNQSWSVSGDVFVSFVGADGDQEQGFAILPNSGTFSSASPLWCWRKDGQETVTCTAEA